MKNNRVEKRSRNSYSTKSNKIKVFKTPGNQLNTIKIKKKKKERTCPIEREKIKGLNTPGSRRYRRSSKIGRKVSRTYGGCLSFHAVRKNITKAFLIEEKKLAKKVLLLKKK